VTRRCPDEISFICSPIELLGKIIDEILSAIFDGLLEPFITSIFDALGLDDVLAQLPGLEWFDSLNNGLEGFAQKIYDELSSYYDDITGQFKPYMDIR
jgi:hypothetical protein